MITKRRLHMTSRVVAVALAATFLCGIAGAAELPSKRLGRPLRIHIARGLWWQALRLYEAFGQLGGADITNSVDVNGSTSGYHGCARAMGTFPHSREELAAHDIIVLAGSRVAALPEKTQTKLVAWVKAGGGLLITGGPMSLDRDKYGPLASILPVTLTERERIVKLPDAVLKASSGSGLDSFNWAASPRIYWINDGVAAKEGSSSLLEAGGRPMMLTTAVGKGRVTVFVGTVCGDPQEGELGFWDWPDWPGVLKMVLAGLAPKRPITFALDPVSKADLAAAEERLAELADSGLEGLLDEEEGIPVDNDGAGSLGKELATLAGLTRTKEFATLIIKSVAGSSARLTLAESDNIYDAVIPYLDADAIGDTPTELTRSTGPGTVALGMRLAGAAGQKAVGPTMVKFLSKGLSGVQSDEEGEGIVSTGVGVPDGKDEKLRFAAARALSVLADPALISPVRKALADWDRYRNRIQILAMHQRDVKEMTWASLATMGDNDAAVWVIDRIIANSLEREYWINESEVRGTPPIPPSDIRRRRKAAADAILIGLGIERLREVLLHLPASTWPSLAAKADGWNGEFAIETFLLILADKGGAPLQTSAKEALKKLQDTTPLPAIRSLCKVRTRR